MESKPIEYSSWDIHFIWIFKQLIWNKRFTFKEHIDQNDLRLEEQLSSHRAYLEYQRIFENCQNTNTKHTKPSLFIILYYFTMHTLVTSGILRLVCDVALFGIPFFFNYFLTTLKNAIKSQLDQDIIFASSLCIIMFILYCITIYTKTWEQQLLSIVALKARSAINMAIYRKSISNQELNSISINAEQTGRTLNLISNDSKQIEQAITVIHYTWSSIIQIILICVFLVVYFGWNALIGCIVLILNVPIQYYLIYRCKQTKKQYSDNTDHRLGLIEFIIIQIRTIKSLSLESFCQEYVEQVRLSELGQIKMVNIYEALVSFSTICLPILSTVICFMGLIWTGTELFPEVVFTVLMLFGILRNIMTNYPYVIDYLIHGYVSLKRLESYLFDDIDECISNTQCSKPIPIFSYSVDPKLNNQDIALIHDMQNRIQISKHTLTVILGLDDADHRTRYLCSILLGPSTKLSSNKAIIVSNNVWLQNASIRDNIILGFEMDDSKYQHVLKLSGLDTIDDEFPFGSSTIIGDSGILISQGQRQRISLARALYSEPDLLILDDIFAFLNDELVLRILNRCMINGMTIILATRSLQLARYAHNVMNVSFDNGYIAECINGQRQPINTTSISSVTMPFKDAIFSPKVQEEIAIGPVPLSSYISYISECGGWSRYGIPILFLAVISHLARFAMDIWYSYLTIPSKPEFIKQLSMLHFQIIYSGFGLTNLITSLICSMLFVFGGYKASKYLHESALCGILFAPIWSFFDVNPTGRIMNRFSKDMELVDVRLVDSIRQTCLKGIYIIGCIICICYYIPWFIIAVIPLSIAYYFMQRWYRPICRELNRLSSVVRSPYYAQIVDTTRVQNQRSDIDNNMNTSSLSILLCGHAGSIYKQYLIRMNESLLDTLQTPVYYMICWKNWAHLHISLIGCVSFLVLSLICLFCRISTTITGLMLNYSKYFNLSMYWLIYSFVESEILMNAYERLNYYANNIEPENRKSNNHIIVDSQKFLIHSIEFRNVSIRYRPGLPSVLNNITFTVNQGEWIRIYGHSGSGKTTLILSLLRMVESPISGKQLITISSLETFDLESIPIDYWRRHVSMINQDPVILFPHRSIRDNLDPLKIYTDLELWNVLDGCLLKQYIIGTLDENVDLLIQTLSNRQQFCLARSLLLKPNILLLDEWSSCLDESIINQLSCFISEYLKNGIVLEVTHRTDNPMNIQHRSFALSNGIMSPVNN